MVSKEWYHVQQTQGLPLLYHQTQGLPLVSSVFATPSKPREYMGAGSFSKLLSSLQIVTKFPLTEMVWSIGLYILLRWGLDRKYTKTKSGRHRWSHFEQKEGSNFSILRTILSALSTRNGNGSPYFPDVKHLHNSSLRYAHLTFFSDSSGVIRRINAQKNGTSDTNSAPRQFIFPLHNSNFVHISRELNKSTDWLAKQEKKRPKMIAGWIHWPTN